MQSGCARHARDEALHTALQHHRTTSVLCPAGALCATQVRSALPKELMRHTQGSITRVHVLARPPLFCPSQAPQHSSPFNHPQHTRLSLQAAGLAHALHCLAAVVASSMLPTKKAKTLLTICTTTTTTTLALLQGVCTVSAPCHWLDP
jgi:hypothetical protein